MMSNVYYNFGEEFAPVSFGVRSSGYKHEKLMAKITS